MKKIEISHRTVVFTVTFLIILWFLFYIKDIILVFFLSLLIMAILNPTVTRLSKWKIPRAASVLLVYVILFSLGSVAVVGVAPPLVAQTTNFANSFPEFIEKLGVSFVLSEELVRQLFSQIGTLPGQVAKVTISIFSNVLGVLTTLIFALYLLMARDKLDNQLDFFFGGTKKVKVAKIIDKLEYQLGGWARAQLLLMFVVGFSTFIGLTLLRIPFSLPLAILAGFLEIVPNIGPVLSAIPAVIIGFGISPIMGFAAIALYFLIQQVENYIFVPKIMEKSVGVSPIVTLFSLAVGFKLAGIVGVIIAVPVVISLRVIVKEYLGKK